MTRRGWVLFGSLSLIWGIPYLLIKIAVGDVDPIVVAFGRTFIAALLLLPIALYRRQLMPVFRRWKVLLLYTVVEISGPWLLLGSRRDHPEQLHRRPAARRGADDCRHHPDRHRARQVRLPPGPWARHRLRRRCLSGRLRYPVRRPVVGGGGHARRRRLCDRADHHQSPAGRPPADGGDHRVVDRGNRALRPVHGLAVAGADHRTGRLVDRRAGGDLHGPGVPGVLRPDRRGGSGQGDGDHLHQPRGRDHPRRAAAERAVHRRHGDRLPAGDHRLDPGHRPRSARHTESRRTRPPSPKRIQSRPCSAPRRTRCGRSCPVGRTQLGPAGAIRPGPRRMLLRGELRQTATCRPSPAAGRPRRSDRPWRSRRACCSRAGRRPSCCRPRRRPSVRRRSS